MRCDHCHAHEAPHTWDLRACAAAGEERRVNLCASCDLALNALVLRFVRAPDAEALIAAYAAERGLPVPLAAPSVQAVTVTVMPAPPLMGLDAIIDHGRRCHDRDRF